MTHTSDRTGNLARQRPDHKDGVVKPVGLRIIAGRFRRRKLEYSGNLGVRPMRDRVRQAVFNILGTTVAGTHVLDLFAGTGALALEAISRGPSAHAPRAGSGHSPGYPPQRRPLGIWRRSAG